jgi:hypothetical protein|tara:strand:- start:219 stop:443 length:225 start_codon:yes stop_codon:yes gene_type:complete
MKIDKHFLTTEKGIYGFYVAEVIITTDNRNKIIDFSVDRCKSTYDQYQFPTRKEAIEDFENWAGDNWDGVARNW